MLSLSRMLTQFRLQRVTWSSATPSSMPSVAGFSSSTGSVMSLPLTQAPQGVTGASSFILDVGGSTPSTPSVSGLASSMSFGGSSQASSIDVPQAPPSTPTSTGTSGQNIPAVSSAGQHCPYVFVYVY